MFCGDLRASQVVLLVKSPSANAGDVKRWGFDPWVGKIFWRRDRLPTHLSFHGLPWWLRQ